MRQKNIANMQSRPATHHAAANWEDREHARLKMLADRSLAPCCSALRMARQAFSVAQETATASSLDRRWDISDPRSGARCRQVSMAQRRQVKSARRIDRLVVVQSVHSMLNRSATAPGCLCDLSESADTNRAQTIPFPRLIHKSRCWHGPCNWITEGSVHALDEWPPYLNVLTSSGSSPGPDRMQTCVASRLRTFFLPEVRLVGWPEYSEQLAAPSSGQQAS